MEKEIVKEKVIEVENEVKDNKERWVDLSGLPRWESGKNKGKINWKLSVGYILDFKYQNIIGKIEIVNYENKKSKLTIKYKERLLKIDSYRFSMYKIGGILKNETYEYRYNELDCRRVDLRGLPLNSNGIDWGLCVGYKVNFWYDKIHGQFEIIEYESEKQSLVLIYEDKSLTIKTSNFMRSQFGNILGLISNNFKIEIGTIFKDEKRDLTITNRKYEKKQTGENRKYYEYKCNKCEEVNIMAESDLIVGKGCPVCCTPIKKIVLGINTIWDTDRWMIDLGVSEEDAKKYTSRSHQKIKIKCPYCGYEKLITISNIYNYKSICCVCSDSGVSYPEKIVLSILRQLNVDFVMEMSSTNFKWCGKYRYDFYFTYNGKEYIVETHGMQHYKGGFETMGNNNKTLKQEQENDEIKKQLAISNGIKEESYIILDCRYSDLEYIKNSVLNSELNKIFNLDIINWLECEEYALKNLAKEICDYWNNKEEWETTLNVSETFHLSRNTIIKYLKKGNELGWCSYNTKEENKKSAIRSNKLKSKKVEMFYNETSLGIFKSASELDKKSEELLGVRLYHANISAVCVGKLNHYKGYTFKHVE